MELQEKYYITLVGIPELISVGIAEKKLMDESHEGLLKESQ